MSRAAGCTGEDLTSEMKYKLVVAIRSDLHLSTGKMAVQVAHAAVSCALASRGKRWFSEWYKEGQRKIVVKVSGLNDLKVLERKAKGEGLTACLISDAGLTEVPPGTVTCLGIGPAPSGIIDKLTGSLPLL